MAGARLGFLGGAPALMRGCLQLKAALTRLNTNLVSQRGALAALRDSGYRDARGQRSLRTSPTSSRPWPGSTGSTSPSAPRRGLACALELSPEGPTAQELMVALFARRVAVYPGDGLGEQRAATTVRLNLSAPTTAMEHLRGALGAALDEAASGPLARSRWLALLDGKGTARAARARRPRAARPMTVEQLMAEHGSPLWLVDLDRVRARLREFRAAWTQAWPETEVAYSYKTNRLPAILRALAAEGAGHEVVCEAEYAMARDAIGADGSRRDRQRPGQVRRAARARGGRRRPGHRRLGARARARGAGRRGARRACASRCRASASSPTRFGIAPARVPAAAARARALGLDLEALSAHLVSTGFERPLAGAARLGAAITVHGRPPPAGHAQAAARLAGLAVTASASQRSTSAAASRRRRPWRRTPRPWPAPCAPAASRGRLILEPGRALVTDAVDARVHAWSAIKRAGRRRPLRRRRRGHQPAAGGAVVVAADRDGRGRPTAPPTPALVTGPLCLNVDVLHPRRAAARARAPGSALLVRDAGAYQQAQSTRFGDLQPAVLAHDDGRWRLCRRRETLDDLLAGASTWPSPGQPRGGTDMTERLIVIGGGGAGTPPHHRQARQPGPEGVARTPSSRTSPTPRAGSRSCTGARSREFEDLFLSTVERYVDDGLDMRMETTVTDIDLDRGTVTARNTHEGFDKLIVVHRLRVGEARRARAPTSRACTTSRTSARRWSSTSSSTTMKRVVVIGATPLGVEMAGNLGQRGLAGRLHRRGPVGALARCSTPTWPSPSTSRWSKRGVTLHLGTTGRGLRRRRRPRARGRDLAGRARVRRR